jgi:hypothetical protein
LVQPYFCGLSTHTETHMQTMAHFHHHPPLSWHQYSSRQPQHGRAMTRMGGQVGRDSCVLITTPIIRGISLSLQPEDYTAAENLQVTATMTSLQLLLCQATKSMAFVTALLLVVAQAVMSFAPSPSPSQLMPTLLTYQPCCHSHYPCCCHCHCPLHCHCHHPFHPHHRPFCHPPPLLLSP